MADKTEYIFEKDFWGNWKLVPKKQDNGIGWLIVLLIVVVIVCLAIITLPLWIALLGFKMVKTKRYYAGIGSLLALLYFIIDIQNRWITGFLFLGYNDSAGQFTEGLIGEKQIMYVYIANGIGVILGLVFIVQAYLLNKENNSTIITSTESETASDNSHADNAFSVSNSKSKSSSNQVNIILGILGVIFATGVIYFSLQKKKNDEVLVQYQNHVLPEVQQEEMTQIVSSNFDFLTEIISAFNSNQTDIINKYINPNYGLMNLRYDGPYPQLNFDNTINDFYSWVVDNDRVFNNIEEGVLPIYLGDGEFEKTGSFYSDYSGRFRLDDFNLETQSGKWEESSLQSHRELEKLCNYRLQALSTSGKRIYSFYFSIQNNEKYLIGISYEDVSDIDYITSNKNYINIEDEVSIKNYLSQNRFCDNENEAYIDFNNNELVYSDFGSEPYKFSEYKIGAVEKISEKIKIRNVEFINSNTEAFTSSFNLSLSNKGVFHIGQVGARPSCNYAICNLNN